MSDLPPLAVPFDWEEVQPHDRLGGPKYIQDVLVPLPFLQRVPTGGVSPESAREYLAAGAVAVGIGGNLVSNKLVAAGALEQISAGARACMDAVNAKP